MAGRMEAAYATIASLAAPTLERMSRGHRKPWAYWLTDLCARGRRCAMTYLTRFGGGRNMQVGSGEKHTNGWPGKWALMLRTAILDILIFISSGRHIGY